MKKYLFAFGTLSLLACGGTVPGTADIDVAECQGDADVDDTTLIVWDYEESVHEMITCGQLSFLMMSSILKSTSILWGGDSGMPEGFSYENGVYHVQGDGISMDLVLKFGPDTPGGNSGDQVSDNLFDGDSYLVNASSSQDGENTVIAYDEAGPLAALLGQGAHPPNPIVLTPAQISAITTVLGSFQAQSVIHVDDERTATITYDVESPVAFIATLLLSKNMEYSLVSANGSREDLDQTLTNTVWDIQYVDTAHALDGSLEADVTGGPFDYHVVYTYNALLSPEPTVDITCLP